MLSGIIGSIECKNTQLPKIKVLFYQDNAACNKSMKTMVTLNELRFKLFCHPTYSEDLAPSDQLFAEFIKNAPGKLFGSNEEEIAEVEVYLESKDKWFYKKIIENRGASAELNISLLKQSILSKIFPKSCCIRRPGNDVLHFQEIFSVSIKK